MNFNDFILEAADVRDVDMLDIEVAQLIAEMSVIDAMMDCYEKQMILLEYNEDSAEEIFTEAETFVPAMPEYFEERWIFEPVPLGDTKYYVIQVNDKRRKVSPTFLSKYNEHIPNPGKLDSSGLSKWLEDNNIAFFTDKGKAGVYAKKRQKDEDNRTADIQEEERENRNKKTTKNALNPHASGGFAPMDWEDPGKKKNDEPTPKQREDLIRKIMDKQGKSREEAETLADKFLTKGDKKATGLPTSELVAMGLANMDGTPIEHNKETSKSTGRTYAAGTLPEEDAVPVKDTSKTPREDVPKKSFMNGLKKLLSLLGDAAVKLGELIYDAMTSINFVKLGQAFGDRMNKANATTVTLNAKDAALIDGFTTFMEIVDRYGNEFGPNKLANKAGKWVNSKVSGKVKALNDMAKQLDEMNKTDSDSDKNVEVSKITAICDKLGKNDVKKKLREFRRNSAAFKTNLNVEAGVPTELANEMRKFVKKLLSTYTAEAKAVKNILKIAKANDAVEENSESKEPAPVSAGESQAEGWSMNLSEDEDFF